MPRSQKEIEFPLFHVGWATDVHGERVNFTPELLRAMARNSNYIVQAGILQPPVKYDHPAFGAPDKENHGKLTRFEFRNNSLFAVGTNWSERLQEDKAREAVLAYSGEFKNAHEYPDPVTATMRKIGPTVVGLGILGSDRPAIWNLKPLAQFEFAEGTDPIDVHEAMIELRKSGLVAETVEGSFFFGEVVNDASRFFSEEKPKEQTMTDAEIQALIASASKSAADAAVAAAVAPLQAKIAEQNTLIAQQKTDFDTQVTAMSETTKRTAEAHAFAENLKVEKKSLAKLSADRLEAILANPTYTAAQITEIKAFAESLSPILISAGRQGEGDGTTPPPTGEPEALADLKPRHFAEASEHQAEILAAVEAHKKFAPDSFKNAKGVSAEMAVTQRYVRARDIGDVTAN